MIKNSIHKNNSIYKNNSKKKDPSISSKLQYFRMKYLIILILFVLLLSILFWKNPYNLTSQYFGSITFISILLGAFLVTMLSWYNYTYLNEIQSKGQEKDKYREADKGITPIHYLSKAGMVLLGICISGIILYYLFYLFESLSSSSSFVSSTINIIIVLFMFTLVYKALSIRSEKKEEHNEKNEKEEPSNSMLKFIQQLIFFIPRVFSELFDNGLKFIIQDYHSTTTGSVIMLIIMLILFYAKTHLPSIQKIVHLQGGKLLINQPISPKTQTTIASYEQLNGSNDTFEYQYALSFWLFMNSYPPSTNSSYDKFVSILNYGNKPNILYKSSTNTLMITMEQTGHVDKNNNTSIFELDDYGNRIIYKKDDFLLQKWNNIIINFSGGTLDIFINGELVKSMIGIVPYMKLDTLTIGSENNIGYGICNLVYFKKALASNNIYYIYNSLKNKIPPAADESSDETILKLN